MKVDVAPEPGPSRESFLPIASEIHATLADQNSSDATAPVILPPIVPVILSGGAGTRLWPFSTEDMPKQFLQLTGVRSLFQEALSRVEDGLGFSSPIVVGSARHAHLCERELVNCDDDARLILEPCARNTAAAVVMAAVVAGRLHGPDALLLVMPSDHVITDVPAFHAAVRAAEPAGRRGRLVTFGIEPTGPDTGYGYVEMGVETVGAPGVYEVVRFVEKPRLEIAQEMVATGGFLWNAGIFLFRADSFLDEVTVHAPAISSAAQAAIAAGEQSGIRVMPDLASLSACPDESIDYAVMERSSSMAVVPMSPGWSDLGSWDALAELAGDYAAIGPVTTLECVNSYIRSDGLQVAALGVRDLIIVASGNRLLILPKGRSQDVKKLLTHAISGKALLPGTGSRT